MSQLYKSKHLWMLVGLAAGTGCIVVLSGDNPAAEEQSTGEARKVAAMVNGEPIYEDRLQAEVDLGLKKFKKYGMRKQDPALVKRLQLRALDRVIGDVLILQESRKLNVEDVESKVKQKVQELKRKYGAGKRFEMYLKMRRLTLEDLEESYRTRVNVDEYLKDKGILDPEIPEERIRAAYDENQAGYSREAAADVSHILIAVDEDAGAEETQKAQQKAEEIRKQVLDGRDFAELARAHSDCNSASGGGSLGYIKQGYMPGEFEKVAFAMEKNAVSDVVKTKFGYHVIKLIDKKAAGVVPYEEVRAFIKKYLQEGESKKKLAAHIAELREQAEIEVLLTD
jgi:peptidyl-prolyl cis-trans isomerase C